MWEHVCRLLRKWLDEGRNPAPISVNVSRVSMYSPYTVPFICELVDSYHIPHHLFQLELTESAYMDDPDEMKRRLSVLQEKGFEILMDDFGSGYSSLNTLRELPVNYLKIDMNFLSAKEDGRRSRLILASVVRMACWLNIPVITEGVETPEQKDFLNGIGCNYAQGYLFAKPMPVDQYEKLVSGEIVCEEKSQNVNFTAISNLLVNTSEVAHYLAENIPLPVALADVTQNDFSYIRGNTIFREAFGFETDIMDKKQLLLNHVSENEYEVLLRTYQKTVQTKGKDECIFYWKGKDGGIHCYLARTQFLASTSYSSIVLVVFIDVTPYQRIRTLQPGNIRKEERVYDSVKMNETIVMLSSIFDTVRLINPRTDADMDFDLNCNLFTKENKCYRCWNKATHCVPCAGEEALDQHRTIMRLDSHEGNQHFVYVTPIVLRLETGEDFECVLEITTKLDHRVITKIREMSEQNEEVIQHYRELSYKDSLTVAWNRRYYNDMKYISGNREQSVGFILIDLYGFKSLNSIYGHSVGDSVLVEAAAEIHRNLRTNDSVIRYEGDEFLVIMIGCSEEGVQKCADRIKTALQHIDVGEESKEFLKVGTGYSYCERFTRHIELCNQMIQEADEYLRQDKERIKAIFNKENESI